MFCPPTDKGIIISRRMTYFPIKLRDVVVYPTIVYPHQHISIEVIIVLKSISCTSIRITRLVTINTKWRHTEFYPWLALTYGFMDFFNQHIYIVTSPVTLIGITTTIFSESQIIREVNTRSRIWIEIIVHMKCIYIITVHNVTDDLTDVFPIFRQSRIEIQLSTIFQEQFRMFVVRMDRRQCCRTFRTCTIRINPCMKFHVSLMTLINHPLQRIPLRRFPLYSSQIAAPWLIT